MRILKFRLRTSMFVIAFAALILTVIAQTVLLRRATAIQKTLRVEAAAFRRHAEMLRRTHGPSRPQGNAVIMEGVDINSNGPANQSRRGFRWQHSSIGAGAIRLVP
jgi:hypothetical protein